jgi:hypothetical protein
MTLRGKPEELLGKTNPSATLFDTNSTWTDMEKNMGLSGEKTVTNRLVYGTTYTNLIKRLNRVFWKSEPVSSSFFFLYSEQIYTGKLQLPTK